MAVLTHVHLPHLRFTVPARALRVLLLSSAVLLLGFTSAHGKDVAETHSAGSCSVCN